MDIKYAKEILIALSQGVDPRTGELLPEDSICNNAEVVRSFYCILEELKCKKQKQVYENAGKPWKKEEDLLLISEYDSGMNMSAIAKLHKRSRVSIQSRLFKLGKIETPSIFNKIVL